MAVYRRNYRAYEGRLTPQWSRFLVIPRYTYQDVFSSKFVTAFFVACFVVPVGMALLIYLHFNVSALQLLELPLDQLLAIDGDFFLFGFLLPQGILAFLLTSVVGPGLISMDLSNNALPLYLCRPFNRREYVIGKMSVLLILLSLITWIPGVILVLFHSSLAGLSWLAQNWWIAVAIVLGSWIWMLVLALLALAISAWVRWKPVAGAILFGVFFVSAGFGEAINQTLYVSWGDLLDLGELIRVVWAWLFRVDISTSVSIESAWIMLGLICAFCLLLLSRRLKAFEIVRS